ncbi:chemotaxis protein CheW [Sporosarcina sp. JAI121]|uniref:chemotaxis protein CheW n=1 Tax=Sporosarcina sp. JAI121 TaxID=2723064 RepID=UPI0015C75D5A|nr:chemotaxis protein CheW [Sporosarcina sp. JAI121]NYF24057.1 chemotaxis signal transduction protein [Sporosarcina sp. JAI121]
MNTMKSDIVTYEVFEFVEFQVGKSNYGMSIHHVREIIQPLPVTILPHAHPYIEGIIQLRGEVLPVIDLKKVTGNKELNDVNESKYIVAEIGGKTVVFNVTGVTQIQRVNFTEIEPASDMYAGDQVPVSGIIKRDNGMILLVDFEKVIAAQFK